MSGFSWAVVASAGAHAAGLLVAAALAAGSADVPRRVEVPIEVVRVVQEPPPPLPPPPPPRTPPPPRPAPRPVRPAPPVQPARPAPVQPSTLIEDNRLLESPLPAPAAETALPADAIAAAPSPLPAAPRMGGAAGAGQLFSTGDLAVRPGHAADGGSGAGGRAGGGLASAGATDAAPAGVTSFARPIGGYQTRPRYPESARTAGIEGVTVLRFVVEPTGLVGTITVTKSAGHPDLDRSAIEAVRTWRFEPARRGKEPVAVWVTLPVRFELTHH